MPDSRNEKKRRPLKNLPPERFQPKVILIWLSVLGAMAALYFLSNGKVQAPANLKIQEVVDYAEKGKIAKGEIHTDVSGGRDWALIAGEMKEPVFDAADTLSLSLDAMTGMIGAMAVNKPALDKALHDGFITATDLADYFVRKLGMPFREAHHVTGRIVRLAEQKKSTLDKLSLKDMQRIEPRITKDVSSILDPRRAAESRKSLGGTAPDLVKKAVKEARKRFI